MDNLNKILGHSSSHQDSQSSSSFPYNLYMDNSLIEDHKPPTTTSKNYSFLPYMQNNLQVEDRKPPISKSHSYTPYTRNDMHTEDRKPLVRNYNNYDPYLGASSFTEGKKSPGKHFYFNTLKTVAEV